MSTLDLSCLAFFVGSAGIVCWLCRTPKRPPLPQRIEQARARIAEHNATNRQIQASSGTWTGVPPAPDGQPGIDLALHDECALILSLPAYQHDADRLLNTIHEQQEGETP